MSFESDLTKGVFSIPRCASCNKVSWPPAQFCSLCFGEIKLQQGQFSGKILAYSRKDDEYFCMVEIEPGMTLLAKALNPPKVGQIVKIVNCGIKNHGYFFDVI